MALTQDRMIALVSAARRFYNDQIALKSTLRDILASLPINPSHSDCINTLQSIQLSLEQFRPADSDVTILNAEEQHYRHSFRRNQRAAQYARRRRAGLPTSLQGVSDSELAEAIVSAGITTAPTKHLHTGKPLDQILPISKPTPPSAPLPLDQSLHLYNYKEPEPSTPLDPDQDLF